MTAVNSDFRLLSALGTGGGRTAGEVARRVGYTNVRRFSQIIRLDLLRMEEKGWVARLDDKKPSTWVRTPAGTKVMNTSG